MCIVIRALKEELTSEIKNQHRRTGYLLLVVFAPLLSIALLSVIAMIPHELIQQHMEESAVYFSEHKSNKHPLSGDYTSTTVDDAADANLLNVAYYLDHTKPILSVVTYKWRLTEDQYIKSFLEAVFEGLESNSEYSRYWHGSLMLIYPLHLFFSINGIFIILYFLVFGALTLLIITLMNHSQRREAIVLCLSMLMINLWVVPHCLEYTWMFLVTFIVSTVAVKLSINKRYSWFGTMCFATGMIAIFLDFFTTETLTFTIPILLVTRIRTRQGKV